MAASWSWLNIIWYLKTRCEDGAQFGAQTVVFRSARNPRAMGVQKHSNGGGEAGVGKFSGHIGEAHGHAGARWDPQLAFGNVEHSRQVGSAAGEHATGSERVNHTALAKALLHKVKKLAGAGLKNLGEHAQGQHLRLRVGNFDFSVLRYRRHDGVAVLALELLGIGYRHLQTHREVIGEVRAAHRDGRGVCHGTFKEHYQVAGMGSDIEQANPQFAFVGGEGGLGGGDGLENRLADFQARAVGAGYGALQGAA